ncbi:cupin domain-containing protein [Schumannella soli]|uniref:Cupin domain-containing protein n=1 Tax=Schumannella soli TaxID=2590779 RepID=A0A506Y012_9MICO|nr:cupin domain-containing protein [Schumannella soli]TPW74817.1 cupin domain-containing protein [Schumannella soli]
MKHVTADRRVGLGAKKGSQFTGQVDNYMTMTGTDGVTINDVSFRPGARTHWHHHADGQILFVTAGRGVTQSAGGPVVELLPGDVVWVSPGEEHWHGAAPDSFMTHTAVSLGPTVWADAVDEADYTTEPQRTDPS